MGTWGTGPFDNDNAADFRGDLDHLDAPGRIKAIHGALEEAAQETGYLEALPRLDCGRCGRVGGRAASLR